MVGSPLVFHLFWVNLFSLCIVREFIDGMWQESRMQGYCGSWRVHIERNKMTSDQSKRNVTHRNQECPGSWFTNSIAVRRTESGGRRGATGPFSAIATRTSLAVTGHVQYSTVQTCCKGRARRPVRMGRRALERERDLEPMQWTSFCELTGILPCCFPLSFPRFAPTHFMQGDPPGLQPKA